MERHPSTHYTGRKSITKYEHFYWRVSLILMSGNLLIGLGFIFGAPTTSASYDPAKAVMSLGLWGVVAVVAGALYIAGVFRHSRPLLLAGLSLGSFYTFMFAITFIAGLFFGSLQGFTGIIWWLAIALMHTGAALILPTTTEIKRLSDDFSDHSR